MLISGVALFMAFWNTNMLENYIVEKLYKVKPSRKDQGDQEKPDAGSGSEFDKQAPQ